MDSALSEISDFIQVSPPLNLLPNSIIKKIVKEISISYARRGQYLPFEGANKATLYIIRKGALSYVNDEGDLLDKYGEGDICTLFCLDNQKNIKVSSDEDTLLYCIDYESFQQLVEKHKDVLAFIHQPAEQRLSNKMLQVSQDDILKSSLLNSTIDHFYNSPVTTIDQEKSIQQAALLMTEQDFSCLVVTKNKRSLNNPIGIVTDKDFRRRCIAKNINIQQSVSSIMTTDMTTIDVKSTAYDALMLMTKKHIHHLPVIDNGQLKGLVTVTDLMNHEGQNAVNMTSVIYRATSIDELVDISKMIPKLQIRMVKLGSCADHVGQSISAITNAITKKLIFLAEQLLGPSPVPYAWLAAGSQARQEQFVHSDQDNALIIANQVQEEHEAWFKALATFVCDGLAQCGFVYCPGNVMATNPKWRKTQKIWLQYFSQWVNAPDHKALMHCSIFFDLTTIYGDSQLLNDVRKRLLQETQHSTLFIAHLTSNALHLKPPLGFFRDFVLIQAGDNKATLDLKHNGIAPIVDLARIYALSEGIFAVNTIERLKQAAGTPSLTQASAENLIDAYEFLSMLRMEHQVNRIAKGKKPNNYLPPKEISKLEREHLKDAFKVIKTLQDNRQSII